MPPKVRRRPTGSERPRTTTTATTTRPRRRTGSERPRPRLTKPPSTQTTGRTSSASGSVTRPKVAPTPSPTAPDTGGIAGAASSQGPSGQTTETIVGEAGLENETASGGLDVAAIEAAITAIEAQFGLTKEQLLADESEVGRTYRQLIASVNRAREASIEAVLGNALDRGIVRSGIFASNVTEVEQLTAESVADLSAQQSAQQGQIQNALSQAENAAAQAKLTAAQQRGGGTLSQEELEALINGGLT